MPLNTALRFETEEPETSLPGETKQTGQKGDARTDSPESYGILEDLLEEQGTRSEATSKRKEKKVTCVGEFEEGPMERRQKSFHTGVLTEEAELKKSCPPTETATSEACPIDTRRKQLHRSQGSKVPARTTGVEADLHSWTDRVLGYT